MEIIDFLRDMVKTHPNDSDLGGAIRSYVVKYENENGTNQTNILDTANPVSPSTYGSIIKEDSTVSVHYTGKLTNNKVFDSSIGKKPLTIKLGEGSLIPGFENALKGMVQGEKKTINIPCSEAYGDIVKGNTQEIDKKYVPDTIQVGQTLETKDETGVMSVIVKEVKENTVILDGNHPLAGEDLIFELEIVSVT